MRRWMLVLGLVLAGGSAAGPAEEAGFKVVVNGSNSVSSLPTADVARYFLKKAGTWPGGQAIAPVDQADDSPARRAFSKTVLGKDVAAVKSYWKTQIFSGRGVPPPEKASDAAVLAFIEANPGAIGYVSSGTTLGRGVREVALD